MHSEASLARLFPNMTASKYRVKLTESQKRRLSEVANRGRSPVRTVKRALALLKSDQGQTDDRIAEAVLISRRTVVRIRKRFCEEGLESALVERPRTGQKRKLDDRAEAHLVAIACSDPPEGHAHWDAEDARRANVGTGLCGLHCQRDGSQESEKTRSNRGRRRSGASLR